MQKGPWVSPGAESSLPRKRLPEPTKTQTASDASFNILPASTLARAFTKNVLHIGLRMQYAVKATKSIQMTTPSGIPGASSSIQHATWLPAAHLIPNSHLAPCTVIHHWSQHDARQRCESGSKSTGNTCPPSRKIMFDSTMNSASLSLFMIYSVMAIPSKL